MNLIILLILFFYFKINFQYFKILTNKFKIFYVLIIFFNLLFFFSLNDFSFYNISYCSQKNPEIFKLIHNLNKHPYLCKKLYFINNKFILDSTWILPEIKNIHLVNNYSLNNYKLFTPFTHSPFVTIDKDPFSSLEISKNLDLMLKQIKNQYISPINYICDLNIFNKITINLSNEELEKIKEFNEKFSNPYNQDKVFKHICNNQNFLIEQNLDKNLSVKQITNE